MPEISFESEDERSDRPDHLTGRFKLQVVTDAEFSAGFNDPTEAPIRYKTGLPADLVRLGRSSIDRRMRVGWQLVMPED